MATPVLSTRLIAYTTTPNTVDAFAQNAVVTVSFATAASLVLPASTVVNFPIGTMIHVIQTGAGAVTVSSADTVTGTAATVAAGDMLIVVKTAATVWHSALAT